MNDRCFECLHRLNFYCRAYQFEIDILETPKCNRHKKDLNKNINKKVFQMN